MSGLGPRRLAAQHIARPALSSAARLVGAMGALQAQDLPGSQWAIALRLSGRPSRAEVSAAAARGEILRTHALRGTWQWVTPADLRWLVGLVGPGVVARAAGRHRELGLDAAVLRKSRAALERALSEGEHLTRDELGAALGRAGVAASGPRLAHVLAWAEAQGFVCSGALRGKKHTYSLVELRTPRAKLSGDEALAELARRYFLTRGPATVGDFTWWSGLPAAAARRGWEAVQRELAREVLDGQTYWSAPGLKASRSAVHLLPAFDEFLIAYRDRDAVLDPRHVKRINAGGGLLSRCVVSGGRVVATWREDLRVDYFEPPPERLVAAVTAGLEGYRAFRGATRS